MYPFVHFRSFWIQISFVPQAAWDVNLRAPQGLTSIGQYAIVEGGMIFLNDRRSHE